MKSQEQDYELFPMTVRLHDLLVDPNNYRLATPGSRERVPDSEITSAQAATLQLLERESLAKLQESIIASGFIEIDRLVVRKLGSLEDKWDGPNDKFVVIEGNRRTAALLGLRDRFLDQDPAVSEELVKSVALLNVVEVRGSPAAIDSFSRRVMGLRHVSKTKNWWGVNSAALVFDLYRDGTSLDETDRILGLSNGDSKRLYEQYCAYEQFAADPEYGMFARPRSHYALLAEFLARDSKEWLGWSEEKAAFENTARLRQVYKRITATEGNTPEIHNPARARLAVRYINDHERSGSFADGVPLDEIPPFPTGELSLVARLRRALGYLTKIQDPPVTLSRDEQEVVKEIINAADHLLSLGKD